MFLVKKLADNNIYAVKGFHKKTAYAMPNGKEVVHNEIQVMREVQHPNIMRLYGVYESNNSVYLCLELLKGGQLLQRMQARKLHSAQIK